MSAPSAEDLWPSLDESLGRQPCFPSGPVWSVLPTLKGQMADMLTEMKSRYRRKKGTYIDDSNGIVHIDESAIIEPGVHIAEFVRQIRPRGLPQQRTVSF